MVNIKELLGNNNQLQNLLLDTVEEGEVYRLCLTKEEGIIPKNKGDEGRKKFFVVVGRDQKEMRLVLYLSTQKSISTFLKVEGNCTIY